MKVQKTAALVSSVVLALSATLAGCGGLGDGIQPVNAVIRPFGGLDGATTTKAFTCLNTGLNFFVDFTNGARGDFTGRATYTSSNPAVAQVSNFDIPVPEQVNTFYNRGTIVAVAPGTTTITARYLTFTRSIDVTVSAAQNFRITPASADLAAASRLDFSATADLDGVETAIDPVAVWSFVTPNTAVATIDSITGTVTGVAAGTGLTAHLRIPGCGATADAPVTVANLQSLALTREFGDNEQLIVGTSERLIATGTLDNGATQDLTTQVTYTSSDATAVALLGGSFPNLALALKANAPVQLTASFATPAVAAPAINITPVADSLNTIAITPATVDVAAGRTSQFAATGSYASGATQNITRHVVWTSSNTLLAGIQTSSGVSFNSLSGLATTSTTGSGNAVTITATALNAASQTITSTATLNIQ